MTCIMLMAITAVRERFVCCIGGTIGPILLPPAVGAARSTCLSISVIIDQRREQVRARGSLLFHVADEICGRGRVKDCLLRIAL